MDKRDRARRRQLAVRRVVVSAIWAITLFSLTLIIVPAALSGSGFAFGRAARETQRPAASARPTAGPQETPAAPSETPGAEEEPATSPGAEAGEPETAPEEDAGEAESGPEAFAPVPQSEAVGDEYFKDAVFIGNSRTQGLRLYSGLKDATWLCGVGLNVETVYTDRFSVNGKELSAVDALAELAPGKLYIMLGLNELGWKSTDLFAEKYGGIIDAALAANPDCVVYVQSILPASAGDAQELLERLWERNESRIADYGSYLPDEVPKLENSLILAEGRFVLLCTAQDSSGARQLWKATFGG